MGRIISGQDVIINTIARHNAYYNNNTTSNNIYSNIIQNLNISLPSTIPVQLYETDIIYKVSSQNLILKDFIRVLTVSETFKTNTVDYSSPISSISKNMYIYPVFLVGHESGRIHIINIGTAPGKMYTHYEKFLLILYTDKLMNFHKLNVTHPNNIRMCICTGNPKLQGSCEATNLAHKKGSIIQVY